MLNETLNNCHSSGFLKLFSKGKSSMEIKICHQAGKNHQKLDTDSRAKKKQQHTNKTKTKKKKKKKKKQQKKQQHYFKRHVLKP